MELLSLLIVPCTSILSNITVTIYCIPYSGKFLKGFIFKNFEKGQAFSKISFQIFYSLTSLLANYTLSPVGVLYEQEMLSWVLQLCFGNALSWPTLKL